MSKPSFKEQQLAIREETILKTARNIFAKKGYHGTNLNEVAAEVGIARGTIYLHFPTKEDLLAAIITKAEMQLLDTLQKAINPNEDPLQKLERLLSSLLRTYGEYEDLIRVMSSDLRRVVAGKIYGGKVSPLPGLARNIVEEGKKAGVISPQINSTVAANAIFSIVTIDTYRELVVDGQLSEAEVAQTAIAIYLKGIALS